MQHYDEEQAYSIGMLLHKDKNASAEFGVGYMQPSTRIDADRFIIMGQLDT